MTPRRALEVLRPGDAALGRLDVLPTLDGMDDGLWALGALAARAVHVLNDPAALLAAHDKLLTARVLRRRAVVHPATIHVRSGRAAPRPPHPVVLKPRYGSWGREVHRCDEAASLSEALARVRANSWYIRHGALVQELVTPQGYDLRVLVAAGRIVGAVYRVAAEGRVANQRGARRRAPTCARSSPWGFRRCARRRSGDRRRPRWCRPIAGRARWVGRRGAERRGRVHDRVRAMGRRLREDITRARSRGACEAGAAGGVRVSGGRVTH